MSDTISTRRAREIAISFDPEKYGRSRPNTGTILRKAAERGAIVARRDPVDGWRYDERSLRQWLDNESAHKPGPKSNEKPWIYDFVMAEVDSGRPTKIHSVLASIADDGTLEGGVCLCGSQPSGDTYIPFVHLGHNRRLGYFDQRVHPDEVSDCVYNNASICEK